MRQRPGPVKKPGKMNKTEALYASILELQKRAGDIVDYAYESVKFRLANGTWYTPDFFVVRKDHFEVIEIKGFLRDDAAVKFKVAAEQYPWIKWRMIRRRGQQWDTIYER